MIRAKAATGGQSKDGSRGQRRATKCGGEDLVKFDSWRRTGCSVAQKNIGPIKRKSSNAIVVASDESLTRRRSDQV